MLKFVRWNFQTLSMFKYVNVQYEKTIKYVVDFDMRIPELVFLFFLSNGKNFRQYNGSYNFKGLHTHCMLANLIGTHGY